MYETRQHRRAASVLVVDNSRYLQPRDEGTLHASQASVAVDQER